MARVISYLRFSSSKQQQGDSKRRQLENGQKWIEKNKHTPHGLTFQDLGISGWSGKHRSTGALGLLLKAIDDGQIKSGDILLVECLDRLSREDIAEALTLFLNILKSGVKIQVLMPYERLYDRKSINDIGGILEPIVGFSLAHQESQKKSERGGDKWAEKRKQLAKGEILTKRCPAWLDVVNGKFKPNQHAATIKYIFERSVDGLGVRGVLKELQGKFKPFGRSGRWHSSTITMVLSDRSVLGEFQPHSVGADGVRKPCGELIANYYPRIIDDGLWHRTQQGKAARRHKTGRNSGFVNLFTGLVWNARDNERMCVIGSGTHDGSFTRRLVSAKHHRKEKGADKVGFDLPSFERHVIAALREIKPADLMLESQSSKQEQAKLLRLERELSAVESKIAKLQERLANADEIDILLPVVGKLNKDRKTLTGQIELERQKSACKAADPLEQAQSVIEMLSKRPDDTTLRLKLRAVLSNLIGSIYIMGFKVGGTGGRVEAVVQINFRSGGCRSLQMSKDVCGVLKVNGCDRVKPYPLSDLRNADAVAMMDRMMTKQKSKTA